MAARRQRKEGHATTPCALAPAAGAAGSQGRHLTDCPAPLASPPQTSQARQHRLGGALAGIHRALQGAGRARGQIGAGEMDASPAAP